jgi:hypothetical protein
MRHPPATLRKTPPRHSCGGRNPESHVRATLPLRRQSAPSAHAVLHAVGCAVHTDLTSQVCHQITKTHKKHLPKENTELPLREN